MFVKTADSEVLNVIRTEGGQDTKLVRCAKCGGYHTEKDKCPTEEKDLNEHPAKN